MADAAPRILKAVCESVGWELGALWLTDPNIGALVCWDVWHQPHIKAREFESLTREVAFPADIGLPGRVWSSGQPAWIPDVAADDNFPRAAAAAAAGLHGAFGLPIRCNGDILGVAEFFSREIKKPDQPLLDMAVTAGNQIGQFVARKRAEEALHESSRHAAETLESITDAFIGLDRQWRLTYVNSRAEILLGRTRKTAGDVLEKSIWDEVPEVAHAIGYDELQKAMRDRVRLEHIAYIPPFNGWFEITAFPSKDGLSLYMRDISRRQRAEAALHESEERYRELIEALGVAVYTTDAEGRITMFNQDAAELWGQRPELGKDKWCGSWRLFWPDGTPMPHDQCPLAVTLKENRPVRGSEAIAERPDGTRVPFIPFPTPLRDASGKLVGAVNVMVDITERKRAEATLREVEEKYRDIFENALFGVFQTTADGRFISANPAMAEILGYGSPEELVATIEDIGAQVHIDPGRRAEFAETLARDGAVQGFEARARRKDGSVIWISLSGRAVRDSSGALLHFEGMAQDISERRTTEEALWASEERFRSIFAQATSGVAQWDLTGRFVLVNDRYCEMVGRSREELLGTRMIDITHPDDVPASAEALKAMARGGPSIDFDKRYLRPDGSHVWVHKSATPIRNADGHPQFVAAVVVDITERKLDEERQQILLEASSILGSSLDYEKTLSNVAGLAIGKIADVCSIDMVEDGTVTRVALAFDDPSKRKTFENMKPTYSADPEGQHPVMRVVRSGQSELVEDVTEAQLAVGARDSQHLEALKALRLESVMIVPLRSGRQTLGAMTLASSTSGRRYTNADLVFAEELARRAGLAIENSRLYEDAQKSSEQAELARQRVWVLAEASAILGASLDYEATMARLAQLSVQHLADWCVIDVVEEDGMPRRIAVLHPDPAKMDLASALQERFPRPAEGQQGVAQVIRSGKSELYREITDDLLRGTAVNLEHFEILKGLGMGSAICAPLMGFGRVLGAITLVAERSRRQYDEEDLALAEDLGRRAGVAIENARLFGSEQSAREAAENSKAVAQEAQARFWFLAEASAALSASLDYDTTMNRVTRFAVPFLADCCSVHVFPTETTPARSAVTHSDPEKEELVRELHRDYPPREGDDHPIVRLMESEASVIVSEITGDDMKEIAHDKGHLKLLQGLGFVSYMAVPLIARSRLFGAVTFASATPGRRYDKTHLALAEELAGRAALALDNARLYEESQQVQEALRIAGEAKDEFLGMMSHELRTPITAIYGGSRLLRARGARLDEEKKSTIMFDIEHEAERLFRMVENLLVLSRLELGQEAATEPVMAQRVVEKAVSQFRDRRPTRDVALDFHSDTPPVAAQSAYLELVLRNLLSNADKYSPADSKIEVQIKQGADEVEIVVGDRGPGITEEEEEIIFDRFYRSERTSGRASGIGMGLTVCKRLIEAQSGRVWARRREGGGLEITFTIPYYKED